MLPWQQAEHRKDGGDYYLSLFVRLLPVNCFPRAGVCSAGRIPINREPEARGKVGTKKYRMLTAADFIRAHDINLNWF